MTTTIDMQKVRQVEGFQVDTIKHNDHNMGVVTIPAEGFRKLVGYCNELGQFVWVNKNYSKALGK